MNTEANDNRIDYVEFNVSSISASKDFYGKAFGWTFTDYGPDYCEFNDGRLRGGFTTEGSRIPGGPLIVLHAVNLEATLQGILKAGGLLRRSIFDFPGGRRFHFSDPDGYELGVWSEK
jgi:predicted enzyme related to lactoylglutathione lyase